MHDIDKLLRKLIVLTALLASAALWWPAPAQAMRLKEVASVQGVRSNQLVGYGLVVGLDGTGDQTTSTPFTTQSLNALLQQMGVTVPPGTNTQLKNVAAVLVTAQLPAFAQPGQQIDVTVSSLGNAKSLRGGTLIATPLKGADGQIYALAQGNLIIGGAGASAAGSKVQVNTLNAGRVPEGATVERAVATPLNQGEYLQLDLNSNDYNTAREVERAINGKMGAGLAQAMDGRVVRVRMPAGTDARVAFMADIENLPLELAAPAAKVVINARTGSVVVNQTVTLNPCAVAHGSLSVTISSTPVISQPAPFSKGGDRLARQGRHHDHAGARLADLAAGRYPARRRRQGAELARRDAAGPARDPAGDEDRGCAERRDRGDLNMAIAGVSTTTGDAGALDALRDPSGSTLRARAASDPHAAIKAAARQFEAMFMQQLLKSMRESSLGTGMLDNSGTQMGTEMLDTQFANKMAGASGGLADVIARQLERQITGVNAPAQAKAPAPASAAGAPAGAAAQSINPSQEEFLRMHRQSAAGAEAQTGIPASFMVAQAAHESGWGRHEIRNADGTSSHNLFGIKAGAGWTGKFAQVTTTEVVDGQPRKVVAKFRAYDSYDESFRDYARLMKNSPRYAGVVAAGSSAQDFAQGLQRAGYATDPAYADKLTRVINTTLRLQRAALRAPQTLA